jgi:hypothetical protein
MTDVEILKLSIDGYSNFSIPNRYIRQEVDTHTLGVIFPGLHYSCDKPLLYYSSQLLIQVGFDVLQLKTDYTRRDFQFSTHQERMNWILTDSQAAVSAGLDQRPYSRMVLIGKSMGTLAMAGLVSLEIDLQVASIWLTPLLNQPLLVNAAMSFPGPALYLVGTGDTTYIPEAMEQIIDKTGAEVHAIANANHSLEIPGKIQESHRVLGDVLQVISGFLGRFND